ncbi:cell envelope integrity EipB family protein [Methylobacterium sp. 77]|uniref:cell envelope integrity EipB family protein n=1 Tax=Methylobacterium sp. 77 TaxID=1101192 RepID=UPI00037A1886|nr:cell envelope integrity EipB family protein [Methylobacterium sp. 77]
MRLPNSTLVVAFGILAASTAVAQAAPMRLASHRAVYDLSLVESRGARAVESARGRIVLDFSGDACKGYTMQTRQVTELDSGETGKRLSDLRNTTFEGGDGHNFRFKTNTMLNGSPSTAVDGTAESGTESLKVKLKEPKRDQYTETGPVLFPTFHMRRMIEAAQAGETTMSAKVFDGSDDGRKIFDTLAVIGKPITVIEPAKGSDGPDRDKPLREGEMASMKRWPVTLSYFTSGQGERTPVYVLTFLLYENGVSGGLSLNYGDFTIAGDLSRLDLPKADAKAETECKP